MTPLKSSNLSAVSYDNGILTVKFTNGGSYTYHDVNKDHYDNLLKAESAGKYFHKHIRNGHKVKKVKKVEE